MDGKKLENYMAASLINACVTLAGCPAVAVPCGFDRHGRPIGLQVVAPPRQEARALQAAALFERAGAGPLDEGFVRLDDAGAAAGFVAACRKLRFWDRGAAKK